MLVEVDTKRSINERCELHKIPKQDKNNQPVKGGRMESCGANSTVARVLILTTPAAAAADPNIQMTAQVMIEQVNQAMANSNIGYLDIEIAGIQAFNLAPNDQSGTNDIGNDLLTLRAHPQANQLRNQLQADIVVMLTNERYFIPQGQIWGVGGDPSFQINPDFGFGIVAVGAGPNSDFNFIHELGHIMGARHQTCDTFNNPGCDPNPGYFHAHSYLGCGGAFCANTKARMTVVHQQGKLYFSPWGHVEPYERILNFSNPAVSVQNGATGTYGEANNAQTIAERFNAIANYRSSLQASVDGPSVLNATQAYTWEAVYSCGNAPYTFTWALSTNGFNYNTIGSGEFLTYSAGFLYSSQQAWLRLTVTSSDGQTTSSIKYLQRGSGGGFRKAAEEANDKENSSVQLLDVNPNPATGQVTFRYWLAEQTDVQLEVIDLAGRRVKLLAEGTRQPGYHPVVYDTQALPTGTYVYRLNTPTISQSKRLLLAH